MAGGHEIGWKVVGGLTAVVAGLAARKAVETGWRVATGKEPPTKPESPHHTWTDAAGWAILSGIAVALARLAATRKAAQVYANASGQLPSSLDEPVAA